jgi:hypothetical protein
VFCSGFLQGYARCFFLFISVFQKLLTLVVPDLVGSGICFNKYSFKGLIRPLYVNRAN